MEVYQKFEALRHEFEDLIYNYTRIILRQGDDWFYADTSKRIIKDQDIDTSALIISPIDIQKEYPIFPEDSNLGRIEPDKDLADFRINKPSFHNYD